VLTAHWPDCDTSALSCATCQCVPSAKARARSRLRHAYRADLLFKNVDFWRRTPYKLSSDGVSRARMERGVGWARAAREALAYHLGQVRRSVVARVWVRPAEGLVRERADVACIIRVRPLRATRQPTLCSRRMCAEEAAHQPVGRRAVSGAPEVA
jgi:hypothetical protein